MRKLYWDMIHKEPWPVSKVHIDSGVVKALALNKQVTVRNKQINLKHHVVKAAIGNGKVVLQKVDSKENPAEVLTKILDLPTLKHLSKIIQLFYLRLKQIKFSLEFRFFWYVSLFSDFVLRLLF